MLEYRQKERKDTLEFSKLNEFNRTMLIHPQFNPIALSIGPVSIHWYGLMYLVGFALFWALGSYRAKRDSWRGMTAEGVEDLLFYGVLGVILGGRLGYCFFYQPEWFIAHPQDIVRVWDGGMSAHGGVLGVIVAMFYFAKVRHQSFLKIADFVTPLVPLGLFFGRIGNFINGELWGRVCSPDYVFAMIFPAARDWMPRHPSQLYEAGLEGLLLFSILWFYSRVPRKDGRVAALFCLGYGVVRFFVEFFREPDAFLGLQALGLSQGQWLSLPMIALGIVVWFWPQSSKGHV